MKKWILLMLLICGICRAAAEEPAPQPARHAPGEEVPLSLLLTAPKIAGLQMRVAWDPAVFEMVEETAELTPFFAEEVPMVMLYTKPDEGEMTILWMQAKDVALTDVCMLDFVLRVRADASGGETAVEIPALMLTDASGDVLSARADGLLFDIDAPKLPAPEETPAAGSTPVPAAASLLPQAEALVWLAETGSEEKKQPDQILSSRPNDSTGVVVAEPTPVPTPATVVLGSTPVPEVSTNRMFLRVTPNGGNLLVELISEEMTIGGLQATICYDPSAMQCVSAAFTEPFKSAAMIQMVNAGEPGQIKLVYSSADGCAAAGEAIFAAEFAVSDAAEITLTLTDVKCTEHKAEMTLWRMEDQKTVYTIQPMNDLTIINPEQEGAETT